MKKILSLFAALAVFSLPLIAGAQFDPSRDIGASGLTDTSVYTIIITVMQWLLLILTVVAVVGFIISGFMFIIGDSSDKKEKAKGWLTYSIIGIVVALVGYIAINLITTLLAGQVQQ